MSTIYLVPVYLIQVISSEPRAVTYFAGRQHTFSTWSHSIGSAFTYDDRETVAKDAADLRKSIGQGRTLRVLVCRPVYDIEHGI